MLGVVCQQCCICLHGPKSLTGFKLYATCANIVVVPCKRTQQVTTLLGPNNVGCCWPTISWVRLHGPLNCARTREYICVCLVCVSRFIYCNNTACILILRYNVMSLCWENDPGKRPSFDRIHSMLVDQQSTVFTAIH